MPHSIASNRRKWRSSLRTDVPRLKLKWAFGFPGAIIAFAPPTIAAGRLFVGSQGGIVYSLDADSGCRYWEFYAAAPVRSAIVIGQHAGGWSIYFGDLSANVYAVDMMTGKQLWIPGSKSILLDASPARQHLSERRWSYRFLQTRKPQAPTRAIHVAASTAASSHWKQ